MLLNFDENIFIFFIFILISFILIFYYIFSIKIQENFKNNEKNAMLKKLLRQSARWSLAALNDNNNLIAVLHANYGAGYLWAIKDIFTEKEIEYVLGSEELRKKFEKEIIKIQDDITKKVVKDCPNYTNIINFLTDIAGES